MNFEAVAGVVKAAAGIEEAINHELLVIDGQLDGDEGQVVFGEGKGRLLRVRLVAFIAVVEPDELIAVNAVESEDDHHHEIGDKQADIEGVPAIDVAEGVVSVMRLPIVP